MKSLSSKLARRLDAHFLTCTAVLGTGAALLPQDVKADIIYSGPINVNIPNTFDGLYFNFITGASGTSGASTPGWDFNPYNSGTSLSFFWSATPNQAGGVAGSTTGPYLSLSLGTTVSSASVFAAVTATANTAAFQAGGLNYLGIRFTNENTGAVNYGWVLLSSTASTGFPLSIVGYAYENTGAGIQVGAIPEPSTYATLGLMALGAFGLRQWRRAARAS